MPLVHLESLQNGDNRLVGCSGGLVWNRPARVLAIACAGGRVGKWGGAACHRRVKNGECSPACGALHPYAHEAPIVPCSRVLDSRNDFDLTVRISFDIRLTLSIRGQSGKVVQSFGL